MVEQTYPCINEVADQLTGFFISRTILEEAKGGFLDFGAVTVSDHQAVWLDINMVLVGMDRDQDIT